MTDTKQWIVRLICLILILAALFGYQAKALQWESQTAENRAEIEAAEEHNQEVLAEEKRRSEEAAQISPDDSAEDAAEADASEDAEIEAPASIYADGRYSGTGDGFGGEIAVTVTISDGAVTAVDIDSADGEDTAYFSVAQGILDDILSAQSADVDTITGATFSSAGIRDAVRDALEQAKAG